MATYLYETIPAKPGQASRRFEIQQSMKDDPLKVDPETGLPVKRIITGGYGFVSAPRDSSPSMPPAAAGGGCGSGCGCHHNHH